MGWHIHSELVNGQQVFYSHPVKATENLAHMKNLEFSGDGTWATLYDKQRPIRVYMWMNDTRKKHRPLAFGPITKKLNP